MNNELDNLNLETAEFLDRLPRLLQLHNTLKKLPDFEIDKSKYAKLLKVYKRLNLPSDKYKGCKGLPKLTLQDSNVIIQSIYPENNLIEFSAPIALEKNTRNTKLSDLVSKGDIIRTLVDYYVFKRDNSILKPFKSNSQYSSSNLDFLITDFNYNTLVGYAIVSPNQKNLLLQGELNVNYEILIKNLLMKVKPIFIESYLLK
ncbi:hypothetical protein V6O07_01020 [Arthrospira platensis SPKY2]